MGGTRQLHIIWATVGLVAVGSTQIRAGEFQLPPEVTPALRAACEADVRRLCVGNHPSLDGVKSCVMRKFLKLGHRCQGQLAMAGFSP